MEKQEAIQISLQPKVIKKSPQELAAQMIAIITFLELTKNPEGISLDEKYQQMKFFVEDLLESDVNEDQLQRELERLYEEGKKLGIYSPLESERKNEFIFYAKKYYTDLGYSDVEAEEKAREMLSEQGYLAELRKWRRDYEKGIAKHFQDCIDRHPMAHDDEILIIEEIRKDVIYLNNPKQTRLLRTQFSDGNFLFHGTRVEQAIEILETGHLSNAKALLDEQEKIKREGGEGKIIRRNSGYEGISWSYNKIGALPGDRYHLVGFLASPHEVLTESQQLAIPSRPAPYELIQINGSIDSVKYYFLKTQQELLAMMSIGESNSVLSNILQLKEYRENQVKDIDNPYKISSMLQNFIDRIVDDDTEISDKLKSFYSIREDGTIEFSPDLLQQVDNKIPIAVVWFQALIDTGRIKNVRGFEDVTTVRQVIERISGGNYEALLNELSKEKAYLDNAIKDEDEKVTSISIPVSQLYLVVPNNDLEKYLRIIARVGVKPKGIIVYDNIRIRLEHFASQHKGDNDAMTYAIRNAIPIAEGYIDYEEQILGEKITPDMMVGYRKHVIAEKYLSKRRSLRKDGERLIVI